MASIGRSRQSRGRRKADPARLAAVAAVVGTIAALALFGWVVMRPTVVGGVADRRPNFLDRVSEGVDIVSGIFS